jgi:hypothetical protein
MPGKAKVQMTPKPSYTLKVLPVISEKMEDAKDYKQKVQAIKEENRLNKALEKERVEKIKAEVYASKMARARREGAKNAGVVSKKQAKMERKIDNLNKFNEMAAQKDRTAYQGFEPAGYQPFVGLDYEPFEPPAPSAPQPFEMFMPLIQGVAETAAERAAFAFNQEMIHRENIWPPRSLAYLRPKKRDVKSLMQREITGRQL